MELREMIENSLRRGAVSTLEMGSSYRRWNWQGDVARMMLAQ